MYGRMPNLAQRLYEDADSDFAAWVASVEKEYGGSQQQWYISRFSTTDNGLTTSTEQIKGSFAVAHREA